MPALLILLLSEVGESDCEALRDGLLAQPVNALTSLAYVAVGVAIAAVTWRDRDDAAAAWIVFALCVCGVGVGSVLFHGPQPAGSRFLHDAPILLAAVFMLVHDVFVFVPRLRRQLPWFAIAGAAAVAVAALSLDAGAVLTGLALLAVAVAEALIYRRRLRSPDARRQRNAYVGIVLVVALSGSSWLLGRTDGPACDADALFQFHGLWHVVSSLLLGLWWMLASGRFRR